MPRRSMLTRVATVILAIVMVSIASAAQDVQADSLPSLLQWTAAGPGARFMGLVHHTDAAREWAYDRQSSIGHLDKALDEATAKGWTVVDMKADWKTVFPPPAKGGTL